MTLENLRSSVRFAVFGDSSDTTYTDTDLDRNINLWYKTGISWAIQANGDWQVLGEKATTDIVAGQRKYPLPTDILKLNEVYIKYGTESEYHKAKQRDPHNLKQFDPDTYPYQPYPPEFDLQNNNIIIYTPETSIAAVTGGLKVHYQAELTALSNTSDEPDLIEPFEKIIINGAAYEYCVAHRMNKSEQFKRDINELRRDLEEFYAKRSEVKSTRLVPKTEAYEDNY